MWETKGARFNFSILSNARNENYIGEYLEPGKHDYVLVANCTFVGNKQRFITY